MRKIGNMLLMGVMVMSLTGCGGQSTENTTTAETTAQSTESTSETELSEDSKESESDQEKQSETEDDKEKKDEASGENGTFTVGFDQNFPPMGFVGDDGEYTGFDLDLAKEVANRLGMKFVPQPISWDAKDMELDSGTVDCIWNGFTMNGREDDYTWSEPYMNNSQVFVVAADSGINGFGDLAGKIVEVQADSSAEAALKDNTELTKTFGALQTTPDYNTAFMDLEMGAVDAIAMDVIVAGYQIEQRADGDSYVILEETLASEEYGVGFKKGNEELRDKVQAALEEMAEDGTLKEISDKWFGRDVTTIGNEVFGKIGL
ncbi:MAG: amino acid ABC transporter substrate-binding protein [Lachnospiraceae bacterium]|jgi:polar amino acid transport system substrate-binding protein|nr:amino acid ABC transporter substrate-binding protein [Lachnospiraceae bacterium]